MVRRVGAKRDCRAREMLNRDSRVRGEGGKNKFGVSVAKSNSFQNVQLLVLLAESPPFS